MKKFIKLTNILINTSDIHRILIKPNKYCIQIISKKFDGYIFLLYGSGFGNISSSHVEIEVCKNEYPKDYKIVSDWINNIE